MTYLIVDIKVLDLKLHLLLSLHIDVSQVTEEDRTRVMSLAYHVKFVVTRYHFLIIHATITT